jgi:hypothetical protein
MARLPKVEPKPPSEHETATAQIRADAGRDRFLQRRERDWVRIGLPARQAGEDANAYITRAMKALDDGYGSDAHMSWLHQKAEEAWRAHDDARELPRREIEAVLRAPAMLEPEPSSVPPAAPSGSFAEVRPPSAAG